MLEPSIDFSLTDVHSLVIRHIYNQETTLQAALHKDKAAAFRAFVNDPLVNLPPDKAGQLFDRMLQSTKAFLPGWQL